MIGKRGIIGSPFLVSMDEKRSNQNVCVLLLLLFLIAFIYSNTLNASWHMDDYDHIVGNTNIQIDHLSPDTICKTFYWGYGDYQKLQRPVAMFTLALNWYFGKNNVTGYHLINIAIHIITAYILFLTITLLLRSPNLKNTDEDAYFAALFSTVLWAINPIQTQAVTYIIQRMASMSAMFYILSVYLYLRGRIAVSNGTRFRFWTAAVVTFLLALGTKENAVMLPVAIFLMEIIFFQNLDNPQTRKRIVVAFIAFVFCIGAMCVLLFFRGDLGGILKEYDVRYFTPIERVMTQPRVLFLYLSQIFYPIPTRLSIAHDIQVSTSLFSPITTLPAILGILGFVILGIWQIRKHPVFAFAVLFYFLNHIIESSIISLELVFEHRNYLPSFFLFWPIAEAIKKVLDYYRPRKPLMHQLLAIFMVLLLVGLGSGTYIRNIVWKSEKKLWEDAILKAPNRHRAYHNLAWSHYEVSGQFDIAMALYKKALSVNKANRTQEASSLKGIAGIYSNIRGDYATAYEYWNKAYNSYRKNPSNKFQAALMLVRMQEWQRALDCLKTLLDEHPDSYKAMNLSGHIYLKLNQPQLALDYFRSVAKEHPFNRRLLINLGAAFSQMGQHDKAGLFFREDLRRHPADKQILVLLVENSHNRNDSKQADIYLKRLFSIVSVDALQRLCNPGSRENIDLPMEINHTTNAIRKQIAQIGIPSDVKDQSKG